MEEKSLRITGANTTFFNKISKTLTKMLIPTKIGINGMLISRKRNAVLKTYENYIKDMENYNKDDREKKYDESYNSYLESLDKYVMDSIYKKVKNNVATEFEKEALSKYYEITSLKEKEYMDYKYRKQKYLLELDRQEIELYTKDKIKEKYNKFYINKMDLLYKAILKNYSIKLADTTNIYDSSKEWIYIKIFYTLEEYLEKIIPIKMKYGEEKETKDILDLYQKFEVYSVGKLDMKDNIEKNVVLMKISRKLFTHSIPLIVAEQCYEKLLKDARVLVQDTKIAAKRESIYTMLMGVLEEYNINLLSTKVYWDNMKLRESYKKFLDKYKKVKEIEKVNKDEYMREKEILFIKNDIKKIKNDKIDYSRIIKYYKRKLVDFGVMKEIKGIRKNIELYKGQKIKKNRVVA